MGRFKLLLTAFLALVLAGLATFLVYRQMQRQFRGDEQEARQVAVATQKLVLGKKISPQDVKMVNWPADVPLPGAFHSSEDVVGRGVITTMQADEPILESKLAPEGAGAGLTSVIDEGKRAISVKVDDVIGVAGFVLPGTRVDVILSGSPNRRHDIEMSRVILENVEVLAAGQNVEPDESGEAQRVQVITLLVTPDQAQKLALAASDGQIQLALRNPLDTDEKSLTAVRKVDLYHGPSRETAEEKPAPKPRPRVRRQAAKPAPPPPPPKPKTFEVELIQGGKRETLEFTEKRPSGTPPSR